MRYPLQCIFRLVLALFIGGCGLDIDDFAGSGKDEGTSAALPTAHAAIVDPLGVECFDNFEQFKRAKGTVGPDRHWHHIVEQHDYNKRQFGERRLNCVDSLIAVDKEIHYKISGHYGRKRPGGTTTVRGWIREQSFADQRSYGESILRQYGATP